MFRPLYPTGSARLEDLPSLAGYRAAVRPFRELWNQGQSFLSLRSPNVGYRLVRPARPG